MMAIKKMTVMLSSILLLIGSINAFAAPVVIEDTVITANVKTKLLANKEVSGLNVHVETKNGIVTLSGHVATDEEGSAAIEIAASTPGVMDVDSTKLHVEKSAQPFEDAAITAKVKGVYLREKLFGDTPIALTSIHVETKNGVVHLSGEAETAVQAKNAKDLAKSVKGVKNVESTVTIK